MDRPKIIKKTYSLEVGGRKIDIDNTAKPASFIEEKTSVQDAPIKVESTESKFEFSFPENTKDDSMEGFSNEIETVKVERFEESIKEIQEPDELIEQEEPELDIVEPQAAEEEIYQELPLSELNLLRTIDEFSKKDIYIEYGFFDNKFSIPAQLMKIFGDIEDEIGKMAKHLKSKGLLKDKQEDGIFGYPFMKKLILSTLGTAKI